MLHRLTITTLTAATLLAPVAAAPPASAETVDRGTWKAHLIGAIKGMYANAGDALSVRQDSTAYTTELGDSVPAQHDSMTVNRNLSGMGSTDGGAARCSVKYCWRRNVETGRWEQEPNQAGRGGDPFDPAVMAKNLLSNIPGALDEYSVDGNTLTVTEDTGNSGIGSRTVIVAISGDTLTMSFLYPDRHTDIVLDVNAAPVRVVKPPKRLIDR